MTSSPSLTTREAGTSKPKPARRRPSTSHLLIGLSVLLAFGLNYLALRSGSATVEVAVAAAVIPEGSVFDPSAVRLVPIDAGFEPVAALLGAEDLNPATGKVVVRTIDAGELIQDRDLVAGSGVGGARTMSIPIAPEHAAGGTITVGDRVDVITVVDGEARFVATDLPVVGRAAAEEGALSTANYQLTVAVDDAQALAIATAIDGGSLEVVRSTGAPPVPAEGG